VTLAGVDSVWAQPEKRDEAWHRLAIDLDFAKLNSMTAHARRYDVPSLAGEILAGKIRGRVVIDLRTESGANLSLEAVTLAWLNGGLSLN